MKTKFSKEEIQEALETSGIDPAEKQKILLKLAQLQKEEDEDKVPKKKYVTVILQREGNYSDMTEVPSLVLQIEETENPNLTVDKIQKAYFEYLLEKKNKKKKKKALIENIFQAVEYIPNKYFKQNGLKIINAVVTHIVTTDNNLNLNEPSVGE
jgi:hypothetical protein